jgi:deazaflavin-dependent oxidoreductase (nitroreductase family)
MDTAVKRAMDRGGVVDITSIGRKTGMPRRTEIGFHQLDGEYFLTGFPGSKRDWLANLKANPEFTVHLESEVKADVPVLAEEVIGRDERTLILERILTESFGWGPEKTGAQLDRWVDRSPLVRFSVM